MSKTDVAFGLVLILLTSHQCLAEEEESPSRDPSNLRLMVFPYPHYRPPEPYTYPGPSPPVKMPPKLSEPYPFFQPRPISNVDMEHLPKWCKSMWERDECGTKCRMLRKICRNIAMQTGMEDTETSPSIAHPMYNSIPYPYGYYKKPVPAVSYSKTNMPNMYYAQPGWQYSYFKRQPSVYRYPSTSSNTEYGLNPQFTYVDDQPKTTTTVKPEESTTTEPSTTTTTESSTKGSAIETTAKPIRMKGTYPVKVTTIYRYPMDSEVTTLSPHMFEYDQYGNKGYYGDRIYMSAMMPVSERRQRNDDSQSEESDYDDFDELLFDP